MRNLRHDNGYFDVFCRGCSPCNVDNENRLTGSPRLIDTFEDKKMRILRYAL